MDSIREFHKECKADYFDLNNKRRMLNFHLLCIILLICLFISLYYVCFIENYENANTTIPHVIWTYWHDTKLPTFIEKCIDTWRVHNPRFRINILNKENYRKYVNIDILALKHSQNDPVRASDFIRLYVLAKHGGIWMDASIICFRSLSFLEPGKLAHKEFIGFHIPNFMTDARYPIIETWCFACKPRSPFITLWYEHALQMNDFHSLKAYVDHMHHVKNVDLQNISHPEYLACHVTAQYVLQKKLKGTQRDDMHLFNATGEHNPMFGPGPFFYLNNKAWNSSQSLRVFCEPKEIKKYETSTFIKLRGIDRKVIEDNTHVQRCVFDVAKK